MKRKAVLIFTRILCIVFIIGTIILFFIVYTDIDNSFVFKFLMGYVFFTIFLLLYVPIITILNLRKLKWIEIRKRLLKFISLFILLGALNYGFDYVFRLSNVNLYRELSIALGVAFGITFIDVIFKK